MSSSPSNQFNRYLLASLLTWGLFTAPIAYVGAVGGSAAQGIKQRTCTEILKGMLLNKPGSSRAYGSHIKPPDYTFTEEDWQILASMMAGEKAPAQLLEKNLMELLDWYATLFWHHKHEEWGGRLDTRSDWKSLENVYKNLEQIIAQQNPQIIKNFVRDVNMNQLNNRQQSAFKSSEVMDILFGVKRLANSVDQEVKNRLGAQAPMQLVGTDDAQGIQTSYLTLYQLTRILPFADGKKFVDIGSGFGRVGNYLGILFLKMNFVGYEIAPEKVAFANSQAERLNLPNAQYIEQDLFAADFELPYAEFYFLFDPTTDEVRQKIIADLKKVAETHRRPFTLIAISGWSTRILSDFNAQPWLEETVNLTTEPYNLHIYNHSPLEAQVN